MVLNNTYYVSDNRYFPSVIGVVNSSIQCSIFLIKRTVPYYYTLLAIGLQFNTTVISCILNYFLIPISRSQIDGEKSVGFFYKEIAIYIL